MPFHCLNTANISHPEVAEISFLTGLETKLVIVEANKLIKIIDGLMSAQLSVELSDVPEAELDNIDVTSYDDGSDDTLSKEGEYGERACCSLHQ